MTKAPLIMPAGGAALQEFELQRVDYMAPEASGYVGGVQAGFPLWAAAWTIGKIGEERSDEWRSFVMECRGQQRRFYAGDLRRPYPKAHLDGFAQMVRYSGGTFDGTASSWSQSIDSSSDCNLVLHGLPSGLMLGTGDYVGFKWDATGEAPFNRWRRAMVRIIRGGGGIVASNGDVTVKVEPAVPAAVPGGAIAHLDNPCVTMKLLLNQTKLDAIDRRGAIRGGTITAIQDLRS